MAELPKYIMLRKVNETKTEVEYQVVEELPTQSNAPNTLKALTNADRIRSLSDEELARFLWQAAPYDNCPPIKCIEFETLKKPTTDECIACWGRWLKQEVKE